MFHLLERSLKTLIEQILDKSTSGRLCQYLLSLVITNKELRMKIHKRYQTWRSLLEDCINQVLGEKPENKFLAIAIIAVLDGLLI